MADQKKKSGSVLPGRKPAGNDIYGLARYYQKQVEELDRREAELRAKREALLEEMPKAVRQMMELSAKFRREQQAEAPKEPPVAETPPALTTAPSESQRKQNGKPNGRVEVAA